MGDASGREMKCDTRCGEEVFLFDKPPGVPELAGVNAYPPPLGGARYVHFQILSTPLRSSSSRSCSRD